mmetsp:Transcript_37129/g.120744  ORF Transcript_37129/g.120744 Transcript_37129/m.120744 type:complete len:216 (-) Transcript_37129:104-751(-)
MIIPGDTGPTTRTVPQPIPPRQPTAHRPAPAGASDLFTRRRLCRRPSLPGPPPPSAPEQARAAATTRTLPTASRRTSTTREVRRRAVVNVELGDEVDAVTLDRAPAVVHLRRNRAHAPAVVLEADHDALLDERVAGRVGRVELLLRRRGRDNLEPVRHEQRRLHHAQHVPRVLKGHEWLLMLQRRLRLLARLRLQRRRPQPQLARLRRPRPRICT